MFFYSSLYTFCIEECERAGYAAAGGWGGGVAVGSLGIRIRYIEDICISIVFNHFLHFPTRF